MAGGEGATALPLTFGVFLIMIPHQDRLAVDRIRPGSRATDHLRLR